MKNQPIKFLILIIFFISIVFASCKKEQPAIDNLIIDANNSSYPLFTLLPSQQTNIYFQNTLTEGPNTNVLMYEYFYNGGGVATGDFNGDHLIDIYFTSNMGDNKFYINKGDFKFEDVTQISKVAGRPGPWKTGVTAVDINGDNKLDLYVCYSGSLPDVKRKNQLFINQGNDENGRPLFDDKAEEYGLASPGYSNQAYFFDYDHDGDLDAILLNHNPKSLPVLNEVSTAEFLKKDDPHRGLRLYNQSNGVFKDVTQESGVSGSALSYGLGVGLSDVNNDGWIDFYISNDYNVPDYLYINNGDGSFSDTLKQSIGHTSHFSMGNDIADINNDGWQDIITLDMLPEDNRRQKLLLSPDNYEKFDLNLRSGFHYQYMRNMLQLNNGNGYFSEIGQLAGISNTDWSWSALLADYNNDGWKDLYVTNGYLRDYTNLDFVNYMENYVQSKGRLMRGDVLDIIKQMPSSDVSNYMFINENGFTFKNETKTLGLEHPSNSNGAAYADLDNDGDLDLIVNNINIPAFIYKNESNETDKHFLQIKLEGEKLNTAGLGSKITVYSNGKQQNKEQITTRGYLSSVSPILHFGLGETSKIDSIVIKWNSGKLQKLKNIDADQLLVLHEKEASAAALQIENFPSTVFKEVKSPVDFKNKDEKINDFKRQPLLICELSHTGPCMTKGDINNDGLEDVFIGGAKGQPATLFIQQKNNGFIEQPLKVFENDNAYEDIDAVIFDANNDGNPDIYVASGGYHNFTSTDKFMQDRLYMGDGTGNFVKKEEALPTMLSSKGCIAIHDMNGDGYMDVFVGGKVIPGRYPEVPDSYLLINDGKGNFTNQIASIAPNLQKAGMITDALWVDMNGDKLKDLIVVGEWMPISIYITKENKLYNETSSYLEKNYSGWWNTLESDDFNHDGKPDFIIGNMGTNTQFKVSDDEPAELYYKDFDDNGSVDPIFSYYIQGKSYPYLTRDELLGQLAKYRSRFNNYESYANVTVTDIFSENELKSANKLTANYMQTTLLLSNSEGKYQVSALPAQVQYAPVYAIAISDYNKDGHNDILLFGNNDHFKLRLGKFDANLGTLLTGNGHGEFQYMDQKLSGLDVRGSVKSVLKINNTLLLGINKEKVKAYKN